MADYNFDEQNPQKHDVIVVDTIQPHHALVKANRVLLGLVFVLLMVVFILGFVFIPRENVLENIGRHRANTEYATQNPVLSAEINTLKGQMFGLVSGSIDSKLRSLEENIRSGSMTASLETLRELKNDVKILGSYSQEPSPKTEQAVIEQKVIKELSELKGLIYLTFISCGLMLAALAGVWLRNHHRLTHHKSKIAFLGREK